MLKTDNIENSEKYIEAMIEIKPILLLALRILDEF